MSEVSRAGFHSTAPPEAAETVAESGNTVGKITAKADPKSPLPSYSKRQGGDMVWDIPSANHLIQNE